MIEAELPDGTILEFPDDTPREVIQRAVKARLPQGQATPQATPLQPVERGSEDYQRAGGHGAITAGVSDAAIKAYLGVKQLFGGLDAEEQGVLRELKTEAAEDPEKWKRIGGNVLGNTMMVLAPGVGTGNAGRAVLPQLAKIIAARSSPKIGALAAAAGTSGATGLALNPGAGESYGEQMADKVRQSVEDAAAGGVLHQVGRILTKPFRGADIKPEAKALMDQNVTPTLQQGAANPVTRLIGGLTSGAVDVRKRQAQEILDAITERAAGGKAVLPGGTLNERVGVLDDILTTDYKAALKGKRFPITKGVRSDVAAQGANVMTPTKQFADESMQASAAIGNIMGQADNPINVGIDTLRNNYLIPLARKAAVEKDPKVKQALVAAHDILLEKARNNRLTARDLELVRALDARNFDVSRLREVSAGTAGEMEGVSLPKITAAYANAPKVNSGNTTVRDLLGPAERIIGSTPTQDQSRSFYTSVKRALPLAGGAATAAAAGGGLGTIATVAAPLYAMSLAGQTKKGAKVLFGETATQKEIARLLRQLGDYMPAAGYALTPEN